MIFNNTSMVVKSWLIACACKIIIKHAKKSRSEKNHIYLYSRSLKQYTKIHSNSLKKIVNKMNVIRNAKKYKTVYLQVKLNWRDTSFFFYKVGSFLNSRKIFLFIYRQVLIVTKENQSMKMNLIEHRFVFNWYLITKKERKTESNNTIIWTYNRQLMLTLMPIKRVLLKDNKLLTCYYLLCMI